MLLNSQVRSISVTHPLPSFYFCPIPAARTKRRKSVTLFIPHRRTIGVDVYREHPHRMIIYQYSRSGDASENYMSQTNLNCKVMLDLYGKCLYRKVLLLDDIHWKFEIYIQELSIEPSEEIVAQRYMLECYRSSICNVSEDVYRDNNLYW